MKNKNDDGNTRPVGDGVAAHRDRRVISAIERVFRLTHNRDMTSKERREFGLNGANANHKKANSGKSTRLQSSKKEASELSPGY